jgi:hypothetical protein
MPIHEQSLVGLASKNRSVEIELKSRIALVESPRSSGVEELPPGRWLKTCGPFHTDTYLGIAEPHPEWFQRRNQPGILAILADHLYRHATDAEPAAM